MTLPTPPTEDNTPPTAPGAGGTGDSTDWKALYDRAQAEAAEWQKRFAGLQGKYQQESDKWKADNQKLAETGTTLQSMTSAKVELDTKLATTAEELDRRNTELEIIKAEQAKAQLVIGKFPHLIAFWDVLPDASAEDLEAKLQAFSDKLEKFGAGNVADYRAGGMPPSPPAKPTGDKDSLWKQVVDAAGKGDMVAYDNLYKEWLKASAPKVTTP